MNRRRLALLLHVLAARLVPPAPPRPTALAVRQAEQALEQRVVHVVDADSLPHPAPRRSVRWGIYPPVYRQN